MNKKGLLSLCAILLALALAVPAAPVLAENNAYVRYTDAGKINLRSGPGASYRVLAAINPGTPLEVVGVEGKWAHVYVADPAGLGKLDGYMYTDYIEDSSGLIVHVYPMNTSSALTSGTSVYSGQYAFPTVTENTAMYVYTGNSGRLHLREYASTNARSLGLFPNGTQVTVLNRSGSWAYVYVNGLYGYMVLSYLASQQYTPVQPVQPVYGAVTKYISTGNSGRLHLREYASQNAHSLGLFPNGTQVSATDLGNGWSYVTFNGYAGYMMTKYLTVSPYTPSVPEQYTVMYVYSPTGSKVVLRSAMSQASASLGNYASGTPVYVLSTNGSWAYISIGGTQGYMLLNSLSNSPYTPILPDKPIGTATVYHPNGSFVYLRSTRSTGSLDNVLAKVPSGASVTVYQRDEWYSLIQYNGITGYMVSSYLYSGSLPMPAPTAQPGGNTVYKMIVGGASVRSSRDESTESNILMELPHGVLVEILLTYPDNWRYIEYNGVKGYIHGQNVATVPGGTISSPVTPSVPATAVIATGVIWHPNGSYVNLRYSRSTEDSSNILAQVPYGSKVDVMEQSGNWTKLRYNGVVGYMVSDYVYIEGQTEPVPAVTSAPLSVPSFPLMPATPTTPAPTAQPVSIPAFPLTPAKPIGKTVSSPQQRVVRNESSTFVYLRSSKDSSSTNNVLMKVPNDTLVELLQAGEWWSYVRVAGVEGYIASRYLAYN